MDLVTYNSADAALLPTAFDKRVTIMTGGEGPKNACVYLLAEDTFKELTSCAVLCSGHGLNPHFPDLDGPKDKRPEAAPDRQHTSGSYRAGGVRGLETRGQVFSGGCRVALEGETTLPIACPLPNADTIAGLLRCRASNARGTEFDLRAVPRRAWLGGGDPLPRPSSRLLIGCNDNRRHAAPSSGHRRAATFGNSAVIHDLSS